MLTTVGTLPVAFEAILAGYLHDIYKIINGLKTQVKMDLFEVESIHFELADSDR